MKVRELDCKTEKTDEEKRSELKKLRAYYSIYAQGDGIKFKIELIVFIMFCYLNWRTHKALTLAVVCTVTSIDQHADFQPSGNI